MLNRGRSAVSEIDQTYQNFDGRLTATADAHNITQAKIVMIRKQSGSEENSSTAAEPFRYRPCRRAAVPYVRGLIIMMYLSQPAAPEAGNNDPESSHRGIKNKFMIA